MIRRCAALGASIAAAAAPGCAADLPAQPWIDHDHAVRHVADRMSEVRTLTAACVLVLDDPARGAITLEGAVAARPPDYWRLQAWKFTDKVLDVTLTPEGLWVDAKCRDDAADEDALAGSDFKALAELWTLVTAEALEASSVIIDDRGRGTFDARVDQPDRGRSVIYTIDRRTLTIRLCRLVDADGGAPTSLRYERYELIDGLAWPMHLIGAAPAGSFRLSLSDIELNGPLDAATFTPPRRAIRQP